MTRNESATSMDSWCSDLDKEWNNQLEGDTPSGDPSGITEQFLDKLNLQRGPPVNAGYA